MLQEQFDKELKELFDKVPYNLVKDYLTTFIKYNDYEVNVFENLEVANSRQAITYLQIENEQLENAFITIKEKYDKLKEDKDGSQK